MTEKEQLRKEIVQLIEKIPDFFYTGGACEEQILQAEKELGVSFPESYKWFLRKYGTTLSIYGIGLDGITSLVKYTQNYREQGLPKSFVVIKMLGYWKYGKWRMSREGLGYQRRKLQIISQLLSFL